MNAYAQGPADATPVLVLATLLFLAVILEQVRFRGGPGRTRAGWIVAAAAPSPAYALAAWAITGHPGFALATAALAAAARLLVHGAVVASPPNLWTGLVSTMLTPTAVVGAWAAFRPSAAAWVLDGFAGLTAALAGSPAPPGALLRALVVAAAYVFVWGSGTVIARAALGLDDAFAGRGRRLTPRFSPFVHPSHEAAAAGIDEDPSQRWGRLIGNLERFIILTLALHGQFAAIGFVLAAKSVARFEMARERAEYYLVGTLTSTGLALTVGLLVQSLVG